jgi:hypothetical protein
MPLFLEIYELNGQGAQAFSDARSSHRDGICCLKHWLSEDGRSIALLVEASDEDALRLSHGGAKEITELFAPAERWMSSDTVEIT